MNSIKWMEWANELRSLALEGLFYAEDEGLIGYYENLKNLSFLILENYSDHSLEEIKLFFSNDKGIQTSKLDSRAAVFKDGRILLVRENDGFWVLPGGWIEPNLSIKENIIKEVKEEAGLNIKPVKIISIQDRKKHNTPVYIYNLTRFFVLCELKDGEFKENEETIESGYFKLDNLPELNNSKTNFEQIKMCFNSYYNKKTITKWD